jgi:8-oxo-dGTP pyrophosphatase MutT (NUDIX family)
MTHLIYAVCILILDDKLPDGKAVGIARKNDPKSFGLLGGKIDISDSTPEAAAIRECKEESGLILSRPVEVYRREYDKGIVITYMGDTTGEPATQPNEAECRWCSFDELIAGRFGEYNIDLFKKLGLK